MNRSPRHFVASLTAAAALTSALAVSTSCKRASDERVEALENRIKKLEAAQKKFEDVEAFVRPVMDAQKEDAARRAAEEPAPNARFAVNIAGDASHGPATAAVTIIEAWDFA